MFLIEGNCPLNLIKEASIKFESISKAQKQTRQIALQQKGDTQWKVGSNLHTTLSLFHKFIKELKLTLYLHFFSKQSLRQGPT